MIMSNIIILYFKIDGIPQRKMLNMSVECDVSVGHCQWWVDRGEPYHSYITKCSIPTCDWVVIVQNVFQSGFWVV